LSIAILIPMLALISSSRSGMRQSWRGCTWVGVESAGISSHQPVQRPWCPQGHFLVAFDLDGDRRYSPHDTPVVGQAMCCQANSWSNQWGTLAWYGVQKAGINSHQPGRPWCPGGSFLVAFDLDGDRNYSPHDAPLVGQAMCASLAGTPQGRWGRCFWVNVGKAGINSHQPVGPWCPEGTFLVAFDLDGDRRYSPYDAPVVGQAMCCSLP
jgi:hypothetical protein